MKKLFFTTFLLLFIQSTLIAPSTVISRGTQTVATGNSVMMTQLQQGYASQEDNILKAQYINGILDSDNGANIEKKIKQANILIKIINNDIALHTDGWLYNSDQAQIDWLKEQKIKIKNRINQFQWQAQSFGMKALWQTAKWSTIYLGIILAAYVAKDQFIFIGNDGNQYRPTYGQLAWMPLESLLDLAKNAVLATKDTVTSSPVQNSLAMAAVLANKTKEGIIEAADTIKEKGSLKIQKNLHSLSNYFAGLTENPNELFETAEGQNMFQKILRQSSAERDKQEALKAKRDYMKYHNNMITKMQEAANKTNITMKAEEAKKEYYLLQKQVDEIENTRRNRDLDKINQKDPFYHSNR
jgi:hypothetical protein